MAADVKPWHDAPTCGRCSLPAVTPIARREDYHGRPAFPNASTLYCAACGATWVESDVAVVAQAWWSVGAHEAKEMIQSEART